MQQGIPFFILWVTYMKEVINEVNIFLNTNLNNGSVKSSHSQKYCALSLQLSVHLLHQSLEKHFYFPASAPQCHTAQMSKHSFKTEYSGLVLLFLEVFLVSPLLFNTFWSKSSSCHIEMAHLDLL